MYNSLKHDSLLMAQHIDSLLKDSADTHKKLEELSKKSTTTGNSSGDVSVKYYRPSSMTKERELKLKVIYLYNIADGIEWGSSAGKGKFVIGVLGKSPLTASLTKELANKKRGLQDFSIVEFENIESITACQVLLVSHSFYKFMSQVKTKVKGFTPLLVSEENYQAKGAHFNLAVDGDALKMSANKELLKKNGFNVSKSLLSNTD
jgi:hypothetical protein